MLRKGKLARRLALTLTLVLSCGASSFAVYAFLFDPVFPCFHSFEPTISQIEERAHVKLPASVANLEWHCQPYLESFEIIVRFTIVPSDILEITQAPGYYVWDSIHPEDFFNLLDDHPSNEEDLVAYDTWQGDFICGWTNLLIDMDDPSSYPVYAHYQSWEDCAA